MDTSNSLGGQWKVRINIPPSYPLHPPEMTFETKICHPNIHFQVGTKSAHPSSSC